MTGQSRCCACTGPRCDTGFRCQQVQLDGRRASASSWPAAASVSFATSAAAPSAAPPRSRKRHREPPQEKTRAGKLQRPAAPLGMRSSDRPNPECRAVHPEHRRITRLSRAVKRGPAMLAKMIFLTLSRIGPGKTGFREVSLTFPQCFRQASLNDLPCCGAATTRRQQRPPTLGYVGQTLIPSFFQSSTLHHAHNVSLVGMCIHGASSGTVFPCLSRASRSELLYASSGVPHFCAMPFFKFLLSHVWTR